MRRLLKFALGVAAFGALAAGPAAASVNLSPRDETRLRSGDVIIELDPDSPISEQLRATIDINAPPDAVWSVLTDCKAFEDIVWRMRECRVVHADPAGRWDERLQKLSSLPLMPDVKVVFRTEYDRPNNVMYFRQVAGELAGSVGEWRLIPMDGGRATRLIYDAHLRLPDGIFVGSLVRVAIRGDTEDALKGIRKHSVRRMARASQ